MMQSLLLPGFVAEVGQLLAGEWWSRNQWSGAESHLLCSGSPLLALHLCVNYKEAFSFPLRVNHPQVLWVDDFFFFFKEPSVSDQQV